MATDICPACGIREVNTPSGFCSVCVVERAAESYAVEDRNRVAQRTAAWAETRAGDRYSLLRRQRKRMVEQLRPRQPATTFDPWTIALEALSNLNHMRGRETVTRASIDEVAEAIRRLAWGPDDGDGTVIVERRHKGRRQIPGQLTLWPDEEAMAA